MCIITHMSNVKMQVVISEELADKFRAKVGEKLGAKKGNISIAFSQALTDWIKKK